MSEAQEEQPQPGAEVVPIARRAITKIERSEYDPQQVALMKATVAKDCSDAELGMFLELCARYELDPFAKQIWAAKFNGSNGPVSIMISRDGLLTIADRYQDYRGISGNVVCANDQFSSTHDGENVTIDHKVIHADPKDRGPIVGAWALVKREGRLSTYFFANWEEYVKTNSDKTPWSKQKSAMILKCAESMALRKAFTITGVVGEDEMAWAEPATLTTPADIYGDDPLNLEIKDAVERLNEIRPGAYREAKVRARIAGQDEEERARFRDEVVEALREAMGEAWKEAEEVNGVVEPDAA